MELFSIEEVPIGTRLFVFYDGTIRGGTLTESNIRANVERFSLESPSSHWRVTKYGESRIDIFTTEAEAMERQSLYDSDPCEYHKATLRGNEIF